MRELRSLQHKIYNTVAVMGSRQWLAETETAQPHSRAAQRYELACDQCAMLTLQNDIWQYSKSNYKFKKI
jgi:hypothetical protein